MKISYFVKMITKTGVVINFLSWLSTESKNWLDAHVSFNFSKSIIFFRLYMPFSDFLMYPALNHLWHLTPLR